MSFAPDVRQLVRQTRASEYADGLHEICLGLLLLAVGLAIFGLRDSPPETGVIGAVVLAVVIRAVAWGITQIRLRYIWPRSGYMKFNHAFLRRYQVVSLAIILVAEIAAMAVLVVVTGHTHRIVAGALFAVLFFAGQWRYFGQTRSLVIGLSVALMALILIALPLGQELSFLILSSYIGLAVLGSGVFALMRFFRLAAPESSE